MLEHSHSVLKEGQEVHQVLEERRVGSVRGVVHRVDVRRGEGRRLQLLRYVRREEIVVQDDDDAAPEHVHSRLENLRVVRVKCT